MRATCRLYSSWITAARTTAQNEIDVEKTFISKQVQSLLYKLTGLDLHGKIFRSRNIREQQRSHYALMTKSMFEEAVKKMEVRGRRFLQFVPVKEPRSNATTILSHDKDIAGFDESKFIFTDITFDATNRNRLVVVRETDGTLRTAQPEEHDRMNRVYYEQPDRPVFPPALFDNETHLKEALEAQKHEFVLDWACYYYEPDDAKYVNLSQTIFNDVANTGRFDLLQSTRHFGPLCYYLVLNEQLAPLLEYFGNANSLNAAADVVRLYYAVFPDWRRGDTLSVPDHAVVQSYLKQNRKLKLPALEKLLKKQ